jgi:hypothetical protein
MNEKTRRTQLANWYCRHCDIFYCPYCLRDAMGCTYEEAQAIMDKIRDSHKRAHHRKRKFTAEMEQFFETA